MRIYVAKVLRKSKCCLYNKMIIMIMIMIMIVMMVMVMVMIIIKIKNWKQSYLQFS